MNDMTRYTMPARSQGDAHRWAFVRNLTPEVECDVRKRLLRRLNGLHCDLQLMHTPHEGERKPFTVGIVRVRTMPMKATSDCVCDSGYGIAPGTVIDEGAAVEDCTRFEAFSEEGCATGIACTPAPHMR